MQNTINKQVNEIELEYKMITCDAKAKTLVTKEVKKKFKMGYDKRRICIQGDMLDTRPWGF